MPFIARAVARDINDMASAVGTWVKYTIDMFNASPVAVGKFRQTRALVATRLQVDLGSDHNGINAQ